jgi:hypothetical protein
LWCGFFGLLEEAFGVKIFSGRLRSRVRPGGWPLASGASQTF